MTGFAKLNRDLMENFARIQPMFGDPRPGHLWTARFELQGIIVAIEDWIASNQGDLLETAQAKEQLEYFRSLPQSRFTSEECLAALKEETRRWTGGKNLYAKEKA